MLHMKHITKRCIWHSKNGLKDLVQFDSEPVRMDLESLSIELQIGVESL